MKPKPTLARTLCIVVGVVLLLFALAAWFGAGLSYGEADESIAWNLVVGLAGLFILGVCSLVAAGIISSSPSQARRLVWFTAVAGFPVMLLLTGLDLAALGVFALLWAAAAALLVLAGRFMPAMQRQSSTGGSAS